MNRLFAFVNRLGISEKHLFIVAQWVYKPEKLAQGNFIH